MVGVNEKDQARFHKKMYRDQSKNRASNADKENRTISKRMFQRTNSSIPNLTDLKEEEDSFMKSKPKKKLHPFYAQQIFGSQIVIE